MTWDLPLAVEIDGELFEIENNCDYRVVLDCLAVYEDANIDIEHQHRLALMIFYKEPKKIKNIQEAVKQMTRIIDYQDEYEEEFEGNVPNIKPQKKLMCWSKDFKFIAPPVSRVLGYDVRTPNKYTHWWTFMGAWMEIGECLWNTILSLRKKKINGERFEKWEERIYCEHKKDIDLPQFLTDEEKEWLFSD